MQGTNRTIARITRLARLLALAILLVVALPPATAAAGGRTHPIKGARVSVLPWRTTSSSVAVAPDGVPWFGTSAPESLSLVSLPTGSIQVENLDPGGELVKEDDYGSTSSLQFDGEGNLWFVRLDSAGQAIVRRAPDGSEAAFELAGNLPVNSLATGAGGGAWFLRGYRNARIGSVTATGMVTQFPLPVGSDPASIAAGPDGAFWFTEEGAGKIGRITPDGKIRLFRLGPHVQPRQIVAGPDGALWFSENGSRGPHKKSRDRIGRITTGGKVTQFPIPFGTGSELLAPDPRGLIRFTTEKGEISSLATTGTLGAHGCLQNCSAQIDSIAVGPDGALWFAAEKHYKPCLECGGGTAILQQLEGVPIGEIPAGALAPPPAGRRAEKSTPPGLFVPSTGGVRQNPRVICA
jgi:virginiamycin B lyase